MKNPILRQFLASLVGLQFIAACATQGPVPPPQVIGSTDTSTSTSPKTDSAAEPKQPSGNQTEPPDLAFVTQFETALAKRDCETVRTLEKRLVAAPAWYSSSVLLASLWCAQQKDPTDKELLQKLNTVIEQTLKNEAPLFDPSYLELLRAEALASAGEAQSSRQAFAKALSLSALQFMNMVSGQTLRTELQGIESALSGGQLALLRDVRSNLSDPMTQAAALTKFDELLSQASGSLKDRLQAVRLKLFSAFELAFASQLSALEELRLKGDTLATDELASKLRKMFPSRAHQARIDALVGTLQSTKQQIADTPATQCSPVALANTVNTEKGDLTSERALQLARVSLNDGKPGEAVETLDSLADAQKTDVTRRLRREASEAHIRDLRRKANELYQRGTNSPDKQAKLDSFTQCKQILENILTRYPETDSFTRVKIQRFLNSVSENIQELRKAQAK